MKKKDIKAWQKWAMMRKFLVEYELIHAAFSRYPYLCDRSWRGISNETIDERINKIIRKSREKTND